MPPGDTHRLIVDGFCADYFKGLSWKSLQRLQLPVKTISVSSVTAVILYGQPHGLETVRSPLPAQCPFQPRCQWGLYTALACFWHVSSFLLGVSVCPSFCHLFSSFLSALFVCFSPSFFHFASILSYSLSSSDEQLCPLLFLRWNTRSQPDGSSHKFQAACHTFWLGKRKWMHAWPTQQPLLNASGHAAAGDNSPALGEQKTQAHWVIFLSLEKDLWCFTAAFLWMSLFCVTSNSELESNRMKTFNSGCIWLKM